MKRQYMVHSFETESVVFRGTESECGNYINEHPTQELELYWAEPGDRHYIEEEKSFIAWYMYEGEEDYTIIKAVDEDEARRRFYSSHENLTDLHEIKDNETYLAFI